jgi:cardiolipin synthase
VLARGREGCAGAGLGVPGEADQIDPELASVEARYRSRLERGAHSRQVLEQIFLLTPTTGTSRCTKHASCGRRPPLDARSLSAWRPGPRGVAAIAIAVAAFGVFCTWTSDGPVSLNGVQGPNNGWLIIIVLGIALGCLRSLARGWWFAVAAVAGVSVVVAWVAIEDWLENRAVLGAQVGYGLVLVLLASVALAGSAVWRGVQLVEAPRATPKASRMVLPILGLLGAVLLVFVLRQAIWITQEDHWPPPANAVTSQAAQAATEAFAARDNPGARDAAFDFAWSTSATIEPWVDGQTFFPKIFADIEAAKSSVHILMFGWREGEIGQKMAALLERKVAEGVEVRVIVDQFGSRPYKEANAMYKALAAAGVKIVVNDELPLDKDGLFPHQHIDWRNDEFGSADHRKLYVIDGKVGWTGGAGIEDHFANGEFHDVMVRFTGDVVRQAQAAFLSSFRGYGGSLPDDLSRYFPEPAQAGSTPTAFTQVIPGGFSAATQATRELIDGAKTRLDVMNPYLTDADMIERILAAARRGVKVRIVVSATSNNKQATAALEQHYGELIDAGVEIWELPDTVVHAKVIVADDTVSFGTLNLDAWALYRDAEIAVIARSAEAAKLFEQRLFDPDIARSTPGKPRTGTKERLGSWFWDKLGYFI